MIHKKTYLVFLFILGLSLNYSIAQTVFVDEGFENYQSGDRICVLSPDHWFTWNDGPGTAEDAEVTDIQAYQGLNSLHISNASDVLLSLNNKTSGRFEISFHAYVPSGKTAMFGILQDFDGPDSKWGFQCFFDSGSSGSIVTEGNTKNFSLPHNQWFLVKNIIDLDNDHIEIYLNQNLLQEWQWSKGMDSIPGVPELGAMNLFAWNANGRVPEMFVDSIVYQELPQLDYPRNLTYSLDSNNVTLSWNPPLIGDPTGYRVYRNDAVIENSTTELSFQDINLYPGTYYYHVNAIYNSGMSPGQPPVEVTVPGGTLRKFVLLEIATGTWCVYCPGAALAAEDFIDSNQNVAVIEYHNNDDFANAASDYRNNYYGVYGFPTATFDGSDQIAGGHPSISMYPTYLPEYLDRAKKLSLFSLDMDVTESSPLNYEVIVNAAKIYAYQDDEIVLHLVLTESHIEYAWENQTELNFAFIQMYPDQFGTKADFSNNNTFSNSYSVELNPGSNVANFELVAFLQDNNTKEILQAEKIKLFHTGIESILTSNERISIYPNPASGKLTIESRMPMEHYQVLDQLGRIIKESVDPAALNQSLYKTVIDVSDLKKGVYFLSVKSKEYNSIEKLIVN